MSRKNAKVQLATKLHKETQKRKKCQRKKCQARKTRGVFKYRTLEEANKAKEEWLLQNALKKRASRDNKNE
ncbi:MAG: hypothetical protein JSV88_05485 [Candidatus Aminicenantes bacterium]|nr:MAG: hypothetical protein JSV88_05485 [Candidatus Aminicenantes bacterium]